MGTRAQRAARTEKGHGVVPGFCKRSSLGILSPEFCPPPAPYQVQEAERSPEKESIERPKGFSRFGRFHDPDPLRCYTSTLLLYLKTRWRPRRRPPKTSSKQETHKSSSMESGVVTDPANYKQALGWSTEQMVTNGNRFIERDYHKVKEWVEMGYLDPRHVKGIENPSDLFTKSVDAPTQRHLGPVISGKVLLNPVSLPLNALTKKEPKVAYVRKSKM